jgi:hypothetical protein
MISTGNIETAEGELSAVREEAGPATPDTAGPDHGENQPQ